MTMIKLLLISAGLAIGFVGLGYLGPAESMYARYSIEILSVNQFNMVRGAYGGLFLTFAALFLLGAFKDKYTFSALIGLLTFMFGFAIGRIASIIQDGNPSTLIYSLLAFEVFYSVASIYCLRKLDG